MSKIFSSIVSEGPILLTHRIERLKAGGPCDPAGFKYA